MIIKYFNKHLPNVINYCFIHLKGTGKKNFYCHLADLTVSKRPGTSNRIEIHFAVVNHLYLCFSFLKLAETL